MTPGRPCDPAVRLCRDCLARHLDRKPPSGVRGEGSPWRRWFEGDRYVGLAYANGGGHMGDKAVTTDGDMHQNAKDGTK
jgi:hypothetical protein